VIRGHEPSDSVATTALLAALSHALDLTEGHPRGHAERTCALGLALADRLGASALSGDLVHAALLKDAGCSSNAARVYELFGGPEHGVKRAVWERDWRNPIAQVTYAARWVERGGSPGARLKRLLGLAVAGSQASRELFQIRCARGAEIASHLGFPPPVTSAIHDMDEHWDGGGHPRGLAGDAIPLLARIIGAAQVMEIFWGLGGPQAARTVLATRAGRWFDPEIARAAASLDDRHDVWRLLRSPDLTTTLLGHVPDESALPCTPERVDRIAEAVALIIDGKSPFTRSHSDRVARCAVELGRRLGGDTAFLTRLRRAALVHDVGKLTVPNSILDAPRPLTPPEWQVVRQHAAYTYSILQRVPVLSELAFDAASHHERLDGTGYCRGLRGDAISRTARILAVADVADALAADRPYRRGLAPDDVLGILHQGAGTHLCRVCVGVCSADLVEDVAAA
jgi:HD-GYP domain-containing protein (c-di-GMP phosphodiesterase class II)